MSNTTITDYKDPEMLIYYYKCRFREIIERRHYEPFDKFNEFGFINTDAPDIFYLDHHLGYLNIGDDLKDRIERLSKKLKKSFVCIPIVGPYKLIVFIEVYRPEKMI